MNKDEAKAILSDQLKSFTTRSYSELAAFIDTPVDVEIAGPSGTKYGIEINVFFDSKPGGDLRIIGSIDDGGWRAVVPLSDSLIMKPDGNLV
jgi:hypothetical protein